MTQKREGGGRLSYKNDRPLWLQNQSSVFRQNYNFCYYFEIVSILEDSLSSKICQIALKFYWDLGRRFVFYNNWWNKGLSVVSFRFGLKGHARKNACASISSRKMSPQFPIGVVLSSPPSLNFCRSVFDLEEEEEKVLLGIFLRHLLVSSWWLFLTWGSNKGWKIYRLTSLKEEKSPEFSWKLLDLIQM